MVASPQRECLILIRRSMMSITSDKKTEIINEFAIKSGDTGSPEVQVAILTERIST